MKTWLFTCKVCDQVFKVPYHSDPGHIADKDIEVIEHEEHHIENGEQIDWDLKLEEVADVTGNASKEG